MRKSIALMGLLFALVNGQSREKSLSESIPGEPGVDYPIFSSIEKTSFSCEDKVFGGYYADPELRCQAYHVCFSDPITEESYYVSFLCPNGTIFQQSKFGCDWWFNVDCSKAESFYGLAENAFAFNPGENGGAAGIAGSCPAVNPLSEAECVGTVSNCWSPGFTDIDCPNFGLCCFDGCQDTCVDDGVQNQSGSQILPTLQSVTRPRPKTTTTRAPAPRTTRRTTTTRAPAPRTTRRTTTRAPAPRTTRRTTPAPRPRTTRRTTQKPKTTEKGYNYQRPENPLTIPPRTTITTPSSLYGVPLGGSIG